MAFIIMRGKLLLVYLQHKRQSLPWKSQEAILSGNTRPAVATQAGCGRAGKHPGAPGGTQLGGILVKKIIFCSHLPSPHLVPQADLLCGKHRDLP